MPDAGRQIWEIRVPRNVELTPLKNKMSKNKTKMLKKEPKGKYRIKEKWMKKRDEWKDNEKWSFMKWFLVKITLKHILGLFIFFFETMNPGLYYVPEKSILIERGYLDWRGFFLNLS